jgi:hypothetical protein
VPVNAIKARVYWGFDLFLPGLPRLLPFYLSGTGPGQTTDKNLNLATDLPIAQRFLMRRPKRAGAISTLAPPLSHPLRHTSRMKHTLHLVPDRVRPELIAAFGDAQIVKHLNGKLEVLGGTDAEQSQAYGWMRQFLARGPLTLRRVR